MGLKDLFTRKKQKTEAAAQLQKIAAEILRIYTSHSDAITGHDATSFSAQDIICSAFASLSGSFFDRNTRQAVKDHYLEHLLQRPNFDEDKFLFFYSCAKDYFNGNVYLYKHELDGEIVSLFRLNPASVQVQRDTLSNRKQYGYGGKTYTDDEVIHIPSRFGYNGLKGSGIFDECKTIFNNTAELDEYINNSFNNAIGNRLLIDISKKYKNPKQEDIDQLKALFIQNYAGVQNAGTPVIKTDNIEYSAIETNAKDNRANQLVENRTFQEGEVAKLFRVPLSLLKGTETTNLEALYTMFIENAIRPLAMSFEQAINRLIPYEERAYLYFEYSYNSLLKTSLQARIDAYAKQLTNGMLSMNEVRHKENMPGIEAGDYHFFPANMMPVTEEVIQAYMAKSKAVQQDLKTQPQESDHSPLGDDKT
ncbi:MAG: phage portal protein [Treponema sp.]|jgi:HK97 family phage portal protein|nr:phage portal protein [Treponema sp.]